MRCPRARRTQHARSAVAPEHRSESAAGIVTIGAAAVNDSDSVAEEVKAAAEAPRGERESKDVDGDRGDSRAKFSSDGDSGARESFPTSPNESVQETQVRARPENGVVGKTQGCSRQILKAAHPTAAIITGLVSTMSGLSPFRHLVS